MSEKISVNIFSRSSIQNAKELLMKKQDSIDGGSREAVEKLTQIGYEYMMSIIKMDSGDLADSISWEYDESTNTGRIRVGSSYAIFVEYGTGITGSTNPHPEPAPGWKYDINEHGEKGWTYWDEKAQKYRWTKGQPASAFVYRTKEYMKSNAKETLKVSMVNG